MLLSNATDGAVRLVGGASDNEGRVEVYHFGLWGTVCDDFWDITDANVVCRQLGYSGAMSAPGLAIFGEGSGPVFYDDMSCNGTEARLTDCPHPGVGIENCVHSEDAGVVCITTQGQLSNTYRMLSHAWLRIVDHSLLYSFSTFCITTTLEFQFFSLSAVDLQSQLNLYGLN